MGNMILLVEIDAYDPAIPGVTTLRYCDGQAYRLRPSETPANALYRPLILDQGWTRVDVFSRPGSYGHVTPGEVVLADHTGTLGARLVGLRFDGLRIVIRRGQRGAAYPGGYTVILDGTLMGQPTFDRNRITVRPADRAEAMRKPFPSPRYLGNNALPAGLEGVDDLKGRVKPIVLALASNLAPVLVNSAKLLYQFHAPLAALTSTVAVSAMRDKGVPLTSGGTYANTTDLLNDALKPAAGQYKVLATTTDGTFVRLGSSPIGQVTGDAAYGNAADRTHAQVWKRLLLCMGETSGSISSGDITALDTALAGEIEFAVLSEHEGAALLGQVASSARAACYGDATGLWRLLQWTAPSGSPVATLNALRTIDAQLKDATGTGDVAPAYRVTLNYGRNWTVQADADLGGDKTSPADTVRAPGGRAGLAARAWLAAETRQVDDEDPDIQTAHRNAIELTVDSLLADATAAQNFATDTLTLYKADRHMSTQTVRLSAAQLAAIRVGTVVSVVGDRWGYSAGRSMRVAGIQSDQATGRSAISVWG